MTRTHRRLNQNDVDADGSCYEGSWSESDLSSHPTAYGADLGGYIHVCYRMKYTQTWLLYVCCAI